jgi:transcriptional regulator with XRE-family HTH domain
MKKTIYRQRREELKKIEERKGSVGKPEEWSQVAVAIKCGVSLSTYQLWEKGAMKPRTERLKKLEEVLQIEE